MIPCNIQHFVSVRLLDTDRTSIDFFSPSHFAQNMSDNGLRELACVFAGIDIDISCGFTHLNFGEIVSGCFDGISQMLEASSPKPIEQFQIMFPDQHDFRVQLIDESIRFEEAQTVQVSTLLVSNANNHTEDTFRIHY